MVDKNDSDGSVTDIEESSEEESITERKAILKGTKVQ